MSALLLLIRRDLSANFRSGGVWLPVGFFLLVATLFPFAVGPDAKLLARTGGGVLWVAALLAALLPIERLIEPDRASGVLDQTFLRGVSDEAVAAGKIVAHWLGFGPPLMLAALPAAALLNLSSETLARLLAGLAIGTPGLAALGVAISAITAGLRGAGALTGLLMLPLAVPIVIFGAGSLNEFGGSGLRLLGAASLVLLAAAPFAAGAAIRAARE